MSNRKALLGKKLGMSQVWDENGFFVPVTLVDVSTNVVTAVKTEESDGYKAVQLGYGAIDPTKVTKPLAGHFAKAGVTPRRHLVEVRTDDVDQFEAGQELAADLFEEGAEVDVTGTTKGKGFAGTIKRWGFKSYRRTHGSHKNERRPGSVGACATPSRILKGKRMAGRMGHVTATTQNLTIVPLGCRERHPRHQGRHSWPEGRHRSRPFGCEGSLINHGKRYSERHRRQGQGHRNRRGSAEIFGFPPRMSSLTSR